MTFDLNTATSAKQQDIPERAAVQTDQPVSKFDLNTSKTTLDKPEDVDVGTINQQAFANIRPATEVPGAMEVNNQSNEWLTRVVIPEQLDVWRDEGPIGAIEAYNKLDKWEIIPYLNAKTLGDDVKIINSMKNIAEGKEVTGQERYEVAEFIRDYTEVQTRGYSLGGKFVNGGLLALPYMVEAGVAIASMGISGPATAAKGTAKAGLKATLPQLAKQMTKRAAELGPKEIARRAGVATGKAATATIAFMPHRVAQNFTDRTIDGMFSVTDKGRAIIRDSKEKPATTFIKALGETTLDLGVESYAGPALRGIGGAGAETIKRASHRVMPLAIAKGLDELAQTTAGRSLTALLRAKDRAGFDGLLAELGEERVADVLKTALDLDAKEGYSFEQFSNAAMPDADQWLVEAGIMGVRGGVSIMSHKFINNQRAMGRTENELNEIMQMTSEIERENYVKSQELAQVQSDEEFNVQSYAAKLEEDGVLDAKTSSGKSIADEVKEIKTGRVKPATSQEITEPADNLFKKAYANVVNKLQPIEELSNIATDAGVGLKPGQDPKNLARTYAGVGKQAEYIIQNNTMTIDESGNIVKTGEGLLPIIQDYNNQLAKVEPDAKVRKQDLQDYLVSQRIIQDLESRQDVTITEKQSQDAAENYLALTRKYKKNFGIIEDSAKRIYEFQKRNLQMAVDAGQLSQDQFNNILEKNPNYIPFYRVFDESEIEAAGAGGGSKRFEKAKAAIKKIRGSEREVEDVFESMIKNVYTVTERAGRNKVARSVADLKDIFPGLIKEVKAPMVKVGTADIKVAFDPKLREKLEKIVSDFGGKMEVKESLNKPGERGLVLGNYTPAEKAVRKRLGANERVLAHEVGHMIDFELGLGDAMLADPIIKKELQKFALDRLKDDATPSQKRLEYLQNDYEVIANLVDGYINSPRLLQEQAPNAFIKLDDLVENNKDYAILKDVKPSMSVDMEKITKDVYAQSIFGPKGRTIEYYDDGKKKYIEVSEPLHKAMTGLTDTQLGVMAKVLAAPAGTLRAGATLTPEFWTRNFVRDQFTALMQTDFGFNPVIDTPAALGSMIVSKFGKDTYYTDWLASGGAYSGFTELNKRGLVKAYAELIDPKSMPLWKKLNPIKPLAWSSEKLEQATRVGLYRAAKRAGMSDIEAALASREGTLDFARSGSQTKEINAWIAFLNAGIQGLDKTARSIKDNPAAFSLKGFTAITLPSIMLTYANLEDEETAKEYLEIPRWRRDLFWMLKAGDTWVSIPKPFVLGQIFGTGPERFLEYVYTQDKQVFDGLGKAIFESAVPVQGYASILPTALKPMIESTTNWSYFAERNIVPKHLEDLEKELQVNANTTETSKALGELFNASPAKLENVVRGYTGGLGMYALEGGDLIINSIKEARGEKVTKQPSQLADYPLLKGWVPRDVMGSNSESVAKFYNNFYGKPMSSDGVYTKYRTFKSYEGSDPEKAEEYLKANEKKIEIYDYLNDVRKNITSINKEIKEIQDADMNPEVKREKIKPLAKDMTDLAREANAEFKKFTK